MNDTSKPLDQLRDKAADARETLVDKAHQAKDAVQDKFHELKDKADEKLDAGKEKVQQVEESLARCVREAPMKSVLVAAGVGLVLGFFWRRA